MCICSFRLLEKTYSPEILICVPLSSSPIKKGLGEGDQNLNEDPNT